MLAYDALAIAVLPVLGLVFSFGSFLLGLLAYPFLDFENLYWTEKPLPSYPFWLSVASIAGFALIWLLPVFIRPFQFS
jgi:hypothetical protein